MFTGIIEETGVLKEQNGGNLVIQADKVLEDVHLGDSIAVNGVCLTVTEFQKNWFRADVMAETLRRSSLGTLKKGSRVNLERALAAGGRFGGHIVAGHVDGVGTVQRITRDDNAVWYTIAAGPEILRYVVEKGSIAIDGISLTVARVDGQSFAISAIPHTVSVTTLAHRRVGDPVNLETDVLGKYVEKLLQPLQAEAPPPSGITRDFLTRCGF